VVKHLSEPPPALSQFARVPKPLETCVMRMLEKNPANRPSLDLVRVTLIDPNRRFPVLPSKLKWRMPVAVLVGAAAIGAGVVSWKLVRDAGEPQLAWENVPPAHPGRASPAPPPAVATVAKPVPVVAPPPADGRLEVKLTGATGAAVIVDGADWKSPGPIAPGEHTIEVRAAGRAPIEQHVNVEPGQTFTITIVVPPKQVVRPATRPAVRPAPPKPPPKPAGDDDLLRPKGHK